MKLYKRKRNLPVPLRCRNCGTSIHGRYCHICGQDLFAGRKGSIWNIIFGFFDSILSWDHKLWVTLKLLLFFPGKLTKEYTSGHVVRFVHPSKLFWFTSIIFFTLLTSQINWNDKKDISEENKNIKQTAHVLDSLKQSAIREDSIKTKQGKDNIASSKEIELLNNIQQTLEEESYKDSLKKSRKKNDSIKVKNQNDIIDDMIDGLDSIVDSDLKKQQLANSFQSYAPYAMFLLMPFFAFLLYIFFRKKEHYYVNHLIFAVHFHAFVFIILTLVVIWNMIFTDFELPFSLTKFILLLFLVYFIIGAYVFYRPRKFTLLIKTSLVGCFYSIIIFIVFLILIIVIALWVKSKYDL